MFTDTLEIVEITLLLAGSAHMFNLNCVNQDLYYNVTHQHVLACQRGRINHRQRKLFRIIQPSDKACGNMSRRLVIAIHEGNLQIL